MTNENRTSVRGGSNDDTGVVTVAGEAIWYEPGTLPPRRSRTLETLGNSMALTTARAFGSVPESDTQPVQLGEHAFDAREFKVVTSMSAEDLAHIQDYYEAGTVAYLRSWTVRRIVDGTSVAMDPPRTVEDLLDLPPETYHDLLSTAKDILSAAQKPSQSFGPDGAADPTSPTVASVR